MSVSKFNSELNQLLPPNVSPQCFNHALQVHTMMASQSASPISLHHSLGDVGLLNHGLAVYLRTCSITAFKFTLSWPLQVNLNTHFITASECISEITRSSSSGAPRITLSVSKSSRPSHLVWVWVKCKLLPNQHSWFSIHQNCRLGCGSMHISQPVRIGLVVSRSPSRSIC